MIGQLLIFLINLLNQPTLQTRRGSPGQERVMAKNITLFPLTHSKTSFKTGDLSNTLNSQATFTERVNKPFEMYHTQDGAVYSILKLRCVLDKLPHPFFC